MIVSRKPPPSARVSCRRRTSRSKLSAFKPDLLHTSTCCTVTRPDHNAEETDSGRQEHMFDRAGRSEESIGRMMVPHGEEGSDVFGYLIARKASKRLAMSKRFHFPQEARCDW
mmetsp:Transcript_26839/g.73402  ORF Transcript_26839/g.73402 Transcript_26839/m.73402 type:complete len:113 (-) Transcript_26839:430-768(-)|eukprot:scaffold120983_cov35-Tisochrysis_lutea.AAC.2